MSISNCKWVQLKKINITVGEDKWTIDEAVIEGLRHMESLYALPLTGIQEPLHSALNRLYVLGCQKIEEGGRDLDLVPKIQEIFPNEDNAPKWVLYTDKMHIAASFGYLREICTREKFDPKEQEIVLTAMAVHDCAYPQISSEKYRQARKVHLEMVVGAFPKFVEIVNSTFPTPIYDDESFTEISAILGQHDFPNIKDDDDGKPYQFSYDPPKRELLWAHREADRLWMLDKAGFALDLLRRLVQEKPEYDPKQYLKHVIKRHIQEGTEAYEDNENCITLKENWFGFKGQKTLYRTQTGFKLFLKVVNERAVEYGIDLKQ